MKNRIVWVQGQKQRDQIESFNNLAMVAWSRAVTV